MKNLIVKYGLWHKKEKKIVGYIITSNENSNCCGKFSYTLDSYEDNMWLVDKPDHAEMVRKYSTPWYNADYDNPTNNYKSTE